MSDKPLYVPAKFSIRSELWQGFAIKEAIISGAFLVLFCIAAILGYWLLGINEVFCVFSVMFMTMLVVVLVQKYEDGRSIVDHVRIVMDYKYSQQKFMYVYEEGED